MHNPTSDTQNLARSLNPFFSPRHIAVLGASATSGKLGNTVVKNLLLGGFQGRLSPINSKGDNVEGQPGYRSLAELNDPIDCAFLAIPADAVVKAVEQCAQAGVRTVVIGAAGFAELGTIVGQERQNRIRDVARDSGMRIIGPNTNGLMSLHDKISMGYNSSHAETFAAGNVSIISHSGALFDGIAKRLRGYGAGISKFVAVGNEADVSMLDILETLIQDETTQVIGLIIEGLDDVPRLRSIARQLAYAGKKVITLKIGRSEEGAGATLAHSSRLAGSSRAWDAIVSSCGFTSVRTVEALAGGCALLSRQDKNDNNNNNELICVTTSGAGGALLMDFATDRHFPIAPQWAGPLAQTLAALPASAKIRNPIDMGSLPDWGLLPDVLEAIEKQGLLGPVIVYAHAAPAPGMDEQLAHALIKRRQRTSSPIAVLSPGGLSPKTEALYTANSIPVFHDTVTCFDSFECHYSSYEADTLAEFATTSNTGPATILLTEAKAGSTLSELDSASILKSVGVPLVPNKLVRTLAQAIIAAEELGYPLVLKGMVPGVAHKHQAGFVHVNLANANELEKAFFEQQDRSCELDQLEQTQWLIQPMLRSELELIAGISKEPGLGHFLVCGLGGIHTEAFAQSVLLPIPASISAIRKKISTSFIGRIVNSIDNSGNALSQLINTLALLQQLALDCRQQIASIDINPLLVSQGSCIAVDALIITADPDQET